MITDENIEYILKNSKLYQQKNINILLVNDSKTQTYMAQMILERMNLNVLSAKNGKEAFDILLKGEQKISLILTDYDMPVMNGMQLTQKVREFYEKDKLGIIVLSASNTPHISSEFIKNGANDFINKPYTDIEVITRVNSNLELLDLFEKTRDLANKDFLTGAYNRRYFFDNAIEKLKNAKNKNKNITIAMLDIDKFKDINDNYGHDVGDIAICEVVRILNKNIRAQDLMARFGGEEFCVLLEDISMEEGRELFEKIRVEFEKNRIKIGNLEIKFTVSIGVCYGLSAMIDEMLKIADEGLYFCKNNGRNQIAFNKSGINNKY